MNEFGKTENELESTFVEPKEVDSDINRLEQNLQKYEIELPNLDELISVGTGTLEVKANGEPVKFDMFAIMVDEPTEGFERTAEVAFIEKSSKTEHRGIGVPIYVKLGRELLSHGIVLTSSTVQYGPGKDLWLKLAKLGYAEKSGTGFRFKDRK